MTRTPLAIAFATALAFVLPACGNDTAAPAGSAGDAAGSDAGTADGGTGADHADAAPEGPSDAGTDVGTDAGTAVCPPKAPGLAAVCGRIWRSATLPLLPADPRADGKGSLVVLPFDCDPFAGNDDPASCAMRPMKKPSAMGTPFVVATVDLGKPDSDLSFVIDDIQPGQVHLVAILLETMHSLDNGFAPGDTLATPIPSLALAAGASVSRDLKLTAMTRQIDVTLTLDPAVKPAGDGKGPIVVLGYAMPPAPGVEPQAYAVKVDGSLPVTIPMMVMQAKTWYLTAFLDDDDSSMSLAAPGMIVTPGDLARTAGVPVDIDPDAVTAKATVAFDEIWK